MPTEPDAAEELTRLRAERARLQRLVDTLMDRVEQTTSSANSPFGFFQINAALAEQVAQQQTALRDSRQTLQAIFDAAPVGLLLLGPDLVVRQANDSAAAMLGRRAPELLSKSPGAAIQCPHTDGEHDRCGTAPACRACALRRFLIEAREVGLAHCEHELTLPARPGAPAASVWLSLKAEPVMLSNDRDVLLSLEDISIKKLAERQLREAKEAAEDASRQKSRFLSNVSHEIRTPLNGIMGFAEAITRSPSLDAAQQHAQVILRESTVLLMLVNDLLDMVKIESGRLVLEQVPVDLAQVLRELSQTAAVQARAKGLGFVATIAVDAPVRFLSDPLRLRQILLNLVSNAMKFTARGEVRVSAEAVPDSPQPRLRLSVRDTGIGIPLDKQKAVFEAFVQADVSTTRQYGGTGLGLAIVRQLVGLLGGEVGLQSAPGQGSTFWLELPALPAPELAAATAPSSPDAPAAGRPAPRGRILFAEDYPTNQQIARLFLEGAGHHVTIVSNGQEAVEACNGSRFDLILMDLHMPVMDGQTAAAQIRQGQSPNATTPIVALTASADAETLAACLRSGMSGALTKPFRAETLLAAVAQRLAPAPADDPAPQGAAPEARPAVPPDDAPPIDLARADREFGGRETVARLLLQFLKDAEGQMADLRKGLEPPQRPTLRRAAHTLKGAAATLEAGPLARTAAQLEAACAGAEGEELRSLVESVALQLRRLSQYTDDTVAPRKDLDHAQSGH